MTELSAGRSIHIKGTERRKDVIVSWLLKRKPWLTLADAAAYLTSNTGEYVTEADLLLLAVDGQLKIAARFTECTTAIAGTVNELCMSVGETIKEDAYPLFPGIEGVFDLRLTTPPTIRLTLDGEIESRTFGLVFNTDLPGRVVGITTLTLPATAHWVVRSAALLEFEAELGSITGRRRKDFAEASHEAEAVSGSCNEGQPKPKAYRQEQAVIDALRELGHDPKALPPLKHGHKWVKSEVWSKLASHTDLFISKRTFDKTWERLSTQKDIVLPPKRG